MFIQKVEKTVAYLEKRVKDFGIECEKVYVSLSGGVDSAVVVTILSRAFGLENVVALFRDIRSNPRHRDDVRALQKAVGFRLMELDANPFYDMFLEQCKEQFAEIGVAWRDENSPEAISDGWGGAYASLKSRFATPFAGFVAKAIDGGNGRIYGTGNAEEDLLLRYFDKFGDGAVDNNILVGLTKVEVRQIALWFATVYDADIFRRIAEKLPSADLQANGNVHNDESELSEWARAMGYNVRLSYGTTETEGNIAWIVKQDIDLGVVTGEKADWSAEKLATTLGYNRDQVLLTLFVRKIEVATRHKALGIPGVERKELRAQGLVD